MVGLREVCIRKFHLPIYNYIFRLHTASKWNWVSQSLTQMALKHTVNIDRSEMVGL